MSSSQCNCRRLRWKTLDIYWYFCNISHRICTRFLDDSLSFWLYYRFRWINLILVQIHHGSYKLKMSTLYYHSDVSYDLWSYPWHFYTKCFARKDEIKLYNRSVCNPELIQAKLTNTKLPQYSTKRETCAYSLQRTFWGIYTKGISSSINQLCNWGWFIMKYFVVCGAFIMRSCVFCVLKLWLFIFCSSHCSQSI